MYVLMTEKKVGTTTHLHMHFKRYKNRNEENYS